MEDWLDRMSAWLFFLLDGIELIIFFLVLTAASVFTAWTIFDRSLTAVRSENWWALLFCAAVLSALLVTLVRHLRTRRFYWLFGLLLTGMGWMTFYLLSI